jgi:DNA-binding transcriptional LysR family regulator
MDLDLLRTFLAAVEGPTLTAVAVRRHVTKSAISQQLKALEAQMGLPLFERSGRSLRPTEPAQALATTLREAFATIDDALDATRDAYGSTRGIVRLGAPRPFTQVWLRPRLAAILHAHPEVVLEVSFGTPSELEAKLLARDLDLAILAREAEAESLAQAVVYVETFEAVASRAYLTKHGKPRSAEDLAKHRFVVFDQDLAMHAPWWRATFGARAPLRGHVVARVASLDEMLALATSGVAIAVLPDYFVKEAIAGGRVERLRLEGKSGARPPRNEIVLAWRRGVVETARLRTVREALRAAR